MEIHVMLNEVKHLKVIHSDFSEMVRFDHHDMAVQGDSIEVEARYSTITRKLR